MTRCNTVVVQPYSSSNSSRACRLAKNTQSNFCIWSPKSGTFCLVKNKALFLLWTPYLSVKNPLLQLSSSLNRALIHKAQQSTESSCHQTQSVTSSPLSATPVTLPALSLYPQASSITYRAGHSSGSDVTTTTSPQTNHSPTLPAPVPLMQNTQTQVLPLYRGRPHSNLFRIIGIF